VNARSGPRNNRNQRG
jgi:hypothetical protein